MKRDMVICPSAVMPSRTATVVAAVAGAVIAALVVVVRLNFIVPSAWLEPNGHTGGLLDIAGSIGMSLAVLGLCSFVPRSWVMQPLGSMSLTIYCLHMLSAQWLSFTVSVIIAAVFAVAWSAFFRRGPMEGAMRWCIDRITALVPKPASTS